MAIQSATLSALCILALIASGCGGGLGAKRYGCDGLPSRPLRLSTAALYDLTDQDGPPPAERLGPEEGAR